MTSRERSTNPAARPCELPSNIRVLRPATSRSRDLDPTVPAHPAQAAERLLAELGLDHRFNLGNRHPHNQACTTTTKETR
jgi:hypothetical protein